MDIFQIHSAHQWNMCLSRTRQKEGLSSPADLMFFFWTLGWDVRKQRLDHMYGILHHDYQ